MPDHRDLSAQYNTELSPERERLFQEWATQNNRLRDVYDYDLRGYFPARDTFGYPIRQQLHPS